MSKHKIKENNKINKIEALKFELIDTQLELNTCDFRIDKLQSILENNSITNDTRAYFNKKMEQELSKYSHLVDVRAETVKYLLKLLK